VHFDAAHPGHWLRPVARPGWRGLAQPIWGAGPSKKKVIIKCSPAQPQK